MKHFYSWQLERLPTPLGELLIVSDEQLRLRAVDWDDYEARMHTLMRRQYKNASIDLQPATKPSLAKAVLQAYFEGDLQGIEALEVALGGTDFQREVWLALRRIPAGKTVTYADLAHQIGRPKAVRALGLANGANPIGIVLPCHRVIGSNATLTGYGGGLHRKQWLLEHEEVRKNGTLFN